MPYPKPFNHNSTVNKRAARQGGFTLIEIVVTIAIIAIAMTGIIAVWSWAVSRSADPFWQVKTQALAKIYLTKIEHQPFAQLQSLPPQVATDLNNKIITEYSGYLIDTKVSYAGEEFALAHKKLKKVVVEIHSPFDTKQQFVTYRGDYQ
jgi:MSHA pilin protein MshD